MSATINKLY